MKTFIEDLKKEGINLTEEMIKNFDSFFSLLVEANKTTNLTRLIDEESVYYFHFYDSLMVMKAIDLTKKDIKLLDIGSGPGFPALPLKIVNENMNISIIEATKKKVDFIKSIVNTLKLSNIDVNHMRAEDFTKLDTYDYVTTRAVSTILEQLPYTIPFLKIGGKLIAMKGQRRASYELQEAKTLLKKIGAEVKDEIKYQVLDRNYEIIVIEKIKETPKTYPIRLHKNK
ncbi:16S rRNA (guanine(527)-N(7))-methyltransferase RsmG [bacterium]|nr:16S rRNA (guanine(527)-N(7))-methyltransferase RsmG [bacterium]